MRQPHAPFLLLVALAALLSGCGGSGGGSSAFVPIDKFTLKPGVVQLDSGAATVSSVTADTVVLQNAPPLAAGQVLIHNATDGTQFLRKVVSSTVAGGTTTVTTTDGSIQDVFTGAVDIKQETAVSQADLNKFQPADPAFTFAPATQKELDSLHIVADSRGNTKSGITISINKYPIKDDSGSAVGTISGVITYSSGIHTELVGTFPLISNFKAVPSVKAAGIVTFTTTTGGTVNRSVSLCAPQTYSTEAFGPIKGSVTAQLFLNLSGTYAPSGSYAVQANVTGNAGVNYDPTNGFQTQVDFTKTFQPDGSAPGTSAYESAFTVVQPKYDFTFTGMGDAHSTIDALREIFRSSATTTPGAGFNAQTLGEFGTTVNAAFHLDPLPPLTVAKTVTLPQFSVFGPKFYPSSTGGGGGGGASATTIAYLATDGSSIHFVNPDGSNDRTIITPKGYIGFPQLTLHGLKLAYTLSNPTDNSQSLYVTGANGASPTKLNTNGLVPLRAAWNPAGTELAFNAADTSTHQQIWVITVATGAMRQLTTSPMDHEYPSWSPDGSKVYYDGFNGGYYIYSTDSDQPLFGNSTDVYRAPFISPSGTVGVVGHQGVGVTLFDVSATPNPRTIIANTGVIEPSFSPDGKAIVAADESLTPAHIVTYDLNGGSRALVIPGFAPSWGFTQ